MIIDEILSAKESLRLTFSRIRISVNFKLCGNLLSFDGVPKSNVILRQHRTSTKHSSLSQTVQSIPVNIDQLIVNFVFNISICFCFRAFNDCLVTILLLLCVFENSIRILFFRLNDITVKSYSVSRR